MELKTKIHAEEGKQAFTITREFDLPVELLFKAFEDADLFAEWMGNNVVKMDMRQHGSYRFETRDPQGNVVFSANGSIHGIIPNKEIVRTFEMENTPFPAQMEYLGFEALTETTSRLTILTVFKSVQFRDQLLKLPFASGLNMAHNRLQKVVEKLK